MSGWFAAVRNRVGGRAAASPLSTLAAVLLLGIGLGAAQQRAGRVAAAEYDQGLGLGDPVLRRVGEVEIRASDVFRLMDLAAPATVADSVEELTLMALVRQEAVREGIDVDAAMVDAAVEATLAEQRGRFAVEVSAEMPLEDFVAARHGWNPEQFREHLRQGVLGNVLVDRVVRLHMWRTARDDMQIILVDEQGLAEEIAAKLADGASFGVLARNHSQHPSAAEDGVMPSLPAGLDVPLVEGREDLEPGDVLGPAPISVGGQDLWRFVRLVDRVPADERPWAVLADELEAELERAPLHPDELGLFEAAMAARYGGS